MIEESLLKEREEALVKVINLMRPAVQADGGDLRVTNVDYENGIIGVALEGACGSCALSGATLNAGVERILKGRLDWVTEVVGEVDDTLSYEEANSIGSGAYVPIRPY
ncbi:MAG: NifU family protein [Acidimicrobiales bacterium]|nr:NifU family protein [Acidimicrobiales bacterium]